ncbi:hypothetical protein B0H13DRAFT_1915619 [Mycena leptocephala]|nr:hypothetical protein B0H13DRAFT_1915619 [Mycena leptocephala]
MPRRPNLPWELPPTLATHLLLTFHAVHAMLWYPLARRNSRHTASPSKTRSLWKQMCSRRVISTLGPFSSRRSLDNDKQEDHEPEDALNEVDDEWPLPGPLDGIDEEWPPPPPPDPWDEVDDENPHPSKKPRRKPSFDEVVASADTPHTGPHRTRPAKQAAAAKMRRATKRAKAMQQQATYPPPPRSHARPTRCTARHLFQRLSPADHARCYAGKVEDRAEKRGSKVQRSLSDLLGLGFSTPLPIVDNQGRIFLVLAGQPRNDARFPADMRRHRRGLYAVINVGLSYGKGQKTPGWLNNKEYSVLQRGYWPAGTGLRPLGPATVSVLRDHNAALHRRHPDLRRPFGHSTFFCAAFNFGPNVWTFRHRDVLNLAFGWCAIQALGEFDPTKGGHLVLWDLNLVVEFPPGALILLPSATLAHSNVPVAPEEKRASFTQFSAGGIFRYVDNGFRTEEQLEEENPEEYERLMDLKASRWEEGLNLLSKMDELLAT